MCCCIGRWSIAVAESLFSQRTYRCRWLLFYFMCIWFSYFRKFICIRWIYVLEFNLTGHRLTRTVYCIPFFVCPTVVFAAVGWTMNGLCSMHSLARSDRAQKMLCMHFLASCAFTFCVDRIGANLRDKTQITNENLAFLCGLFHNKMYNIESNDCDTYSGALEILSVIILQCVALDSMFCLVLPRFR